MLTPQDILDKKFEKATFGGYDMALVDDFLEQITKDYTTLYKESAILKSKLKVLVEKVEENRSTEDSMRMALLTAQKMGAEIVDESKAKADSILAEVGERAQVQSAGLKQQLAQEEARLREAERQTAIFSSRVLELIAEEKRFIEQLKDLAVAAPAAEAAPAPAVEATVAVPAVASVVTAVPITPVQESAAEQTQPSAGAYIAQEVSRMTAEPAGDDMTDSPFVEDVTAAGAMPKDPFDEEPSSAADVEFLKMFDQDQAEAPPSPAQGTPIQPRDVRAEEKFDIAQSISSALGDTEVIRVDTDVFYDDESSPTTKRPKFDFDDLQFGTNYDDEE